MNNSSTQKEQRILLVASGMSPQILTETLYALLHSRPPFIPDRIYMVTTSVGRQKALESLLNPEQGHFHQFCRDYSFQPEAFTPDSIQVITDYNGNPLADIVTPKHNEAAADFITTLICQLTREENSTLHVSLAGGRKTMSYYTGYALSLYGRKNDELSHVLVSPGYESLPDFYYPTPEKQLITDRSGQDRDAFKSLRDSG